MAVVIPIVAAIAGYAGATALGYAGAASIAASVGWMVGSWLYSALDPPKTITNDPGASASIPQYNTSIRGAVVPVLFGTNRVASQIIWMGNFTPHRHDSNQGGGKKGGSGGGGKKGQQTNDVTYTYTIDAVYHLGMPDAPAALFGGWIGPTRIDSSSIAAIIGGSTDRFDLINFGNGFFAAILGAFVNTFLQQVGIHNGNQLLNFSDAVYFPGNAPEPTSWDVLTTNLGSPVRWPGTAWVGFQQLDLGQQAALPQISWEVGVANTGLTFNPGTLFRSGTTYNDLACSGPNVDKFEQMYFYVPGQLSTGFEVFSATAQHIVSMDYLTIGHDIEVLNGSGWTFVDTVPLGFGTLGLFVTPEGDNLITFHIAFDNITGQALICAIWEVVQGGAPLFRGAVKHTYNAGLAGLNGVIDAGWNWIGEVNPNIICSVELKDTTFHWDIFPTILDILGTTGLRTANAVITPGVGAFWPWAQTNRDGNVNINNPPGFYLYDIQSGQNRYYNYLSKGVMDANTSGANVQTYIRDVLQPAYPNGAMVYMVIGAGSLPVVDNANWVDIDGTTPLIPFTDEYDNFQSGSTGNHPVYSPTCFTFFFQGLVDLVQFVTFTKWYALDPQYFASPFGSFITARPFIYDGALSKAWQISKAEGEMWNPTSWGHPANYTSTEGIQPSCLMALVFGFNKLIAFGANNFHIGSDAPVGETGDGQVWTAVIGDINLGSGGDVTPPYIIYRIITSPLFAPYNLLVQAADIDTTSYEAAVAYCIANKIYVSTQYRRGQQALDVIEQLLAVFGGYLTYSGDKLKFGVMDGTLSSIRTVDNNHFVVKDGELPVKITRGAKSQTYNLIRVLYLDRSIDYNQNQVEEGDETDQDLSGLRSKEFPAQFVMSEATARTMALRTLWSNLYTRDMYDFKLSWKDHDLEPGDIITLVDSFSNPFLDKDVMITKWKEGDRGVFNVSAIDHISWALTAVGSSYNQTSASSGSIFSNPGLKRAVAYEVPAEMVSDPTIYIGWEPTQFARGATLYLSADNTTYASVARAEPYPICGRLLGDLPATAAVVQNYEVLIYPSSGWSAAFPSFAIDDVVLPDVGWADMHVGAGMLWVGSEMLAYYGVTLVSENLYKLTGVYRGWGGTAITNHSSGDAFVKHGSGLFTQTYTEDKIGTTFWYKVAPYDINGTEYSVASLTGQQYTIQGAWFRPQNASAVQFQNNRGIGHLYVGSTIDIGVAWQDSARRSGYGTGGFGTSVLGYGQFVTDTLSHNWRVEVVGSGGIVVRSTVVSSTQFTYTSSQNFSDNGAWDGNVAFKVTPRSPYGDAPRTSVLSLSLF